MSHPHLILASSSPYRKALLGRLNIPFDTASPDVDERPLPGERAEALALRLATAKATALKATFPAHWIIGSDQVATAPDGTHLNKPGHFDQAFDQLRRCSGGRVTFYTGLTLLDSASGSISQHCEPFVVHFRTLTDQEISHYLRTEQPYDCAGSFKVEGLGITLFSRLEGRDPNSLIGLPLIALNDLLRDNGLDTLAEAYRISSRDSSN